MLASNVVGGKALKVFGIKIDLTAMDPTEIRKWILLFNTFLNVRCLEVVGNFDQGVLGGMEERRALVHAVENMISWGGSLTTSVYCELPIDISSTLRNTRNGHIRSCLLNTMSFNFGHGEQTSKRWDNLSTLYLEAPFTTEWPSRAMEIITLDEYPSLSSLTVKNSMRGTTMEPLLEKLSEQVVRLTFLQDDISFPPRLPLMVEMMVLPCYLPSVRHMLFWTQPSLTTVILLGFCGAIAENARVRLQYAMELDDQLWCLTSRTYTPVLETIQLHGLKKDHFLSRALARAGARNLPRVVPYMSK